MAGILRNTIVVAMGAGALGGPDALGLLLRFAGRSPLVDILIAVFVIAAVSTPALGTMLLARFFRKPRAEPGAGGGATGAAFADPFAKMTLVVSLAVAFIVSASLLVVPVVRYGDLGGPVRSLLAFAGAALVVGAIAVRVRSMHLPVKAILLVSLAAICVVPCVSIGFFHAPAKRLLAFAFKNPLATVPVVVAAATVVGTTLLALFFRSAQNAADAAAAATPPARMILLMITSLAMVFSLATCLLAAPNIRSSPGETDGTNRARFP